MELVKVAKLSEIPAGAAKVAVVDGREVAVFNVGGKLTAIDNICPHRGGPLGEGSVSGTVVLCPWHAWEFDVQSGKCLTVPECRVKTHRVRADGEDVVVEVN